MNIQIENTNVAAGELFRLIWRGWFLGVIALFFPVAAGQGIVIGAVTILGLILWPGRKTYH